MILAITLIAVPQPHLPFVFTFHPPTAHVRFTAGDDNRPIRATDIRVYAVPSGFTQWTWDARFNPQDWGLTRIDAPHTSDEQGLLELPIFDQQLLLEARSEGRWAACFVQPLPECDLPDDLVRDLPLRPDFDVRVRVLDDKGAPVLGVPLVVRNHSQWGNALEECVCKTDAEGRAVLMHAGAGMWSSVEQRKNRYAAAIASCIWPPVETEIDPDHPPTDEIVLRMPPNGEIELVYEDADGKPIPIEGLCAIAPTRAWSGPLPPFPFFGRQAFADVLEHPHVNSVVFRGVGLEVEFGAWTQRNAISGTASANLLGPRAPGERVRAVLHPPAVTHVRGQIVDERGGPRGSVGFRVILRRLRPPSGWPSPHPVGDVVSLDNPPQPTGIREHCLGALFRDLSGPEIAADALGRFCFDLDEGQFSAGDATLVIVEAQSEVNERGIVVPHVLEPAERVVDLGSIRLDPTPLIASGVAVDEAGRPMGGVTVRGSSTMHGGPYRFSTTTRTDGSFQLRGLCPETYTDLDFSGSAGEGALPVVKMGATALKCVLRARAAPEPK